MKCSNCISSDLYKIKNWEKVIGPDLVKMHLCAIGRRGCVWFVNFTSLLIREYTSQCGEITFEGPLLFFYVLSSL